MKSPVFIFLLSAGIFLGCVRKIQTAPGVVNSPASTQATSNGTEESTTPGSTINEGGNGGDTIDPHAANAWFLAAQPKDPPYFANQQTDVRAIRTCLLMSPTFGMKEPNAKALIEIAFSAWGRYMTAQRIYLTVGNTKYQPSTVLDWVACEGEYDLKILLGVSDERVEADKKRFHRPFGFAIPTKIEPVTGWGAGYIWIADKGSMSNDGSFPNWGPGTVDDGFTPGTSTLFLLAMVHEAGHTLGCDHVPGTVMREDFLNYLVDDPDGKKSAKRYLNNIWASNQYRGLIELDRPLMLSRQYYSRSDRNDFGIELSQERLDRLTPDFKKLLVGNEQVGWTMASNFFYERPNGSHFYELRYQAFVPGEVAPIIQNYLVDLPEAPLVGEGSPKVFRMQVGVTKTEFDASGREIYNGNIDLNGMSREVFVVRDVSTNPVSQIYLIEKGYRLPINFVRDPAPGPTSAHK